MPRHAMIDLPANDWVRLTEGTPAAVTLGTVNAPFGIEIAATEGEKPTADTPAFPMAPRRLEVLTLATIAPGIAATTLWARSPHIEAVLYVSHP